MLATIASRISCLCYLQDQFQNLLYEYRSSVGKDENAIPARFYNLSFAPLISRMVLASHD
jgi:hypothetical protein